MVCKLAKAIDALLAFINVRNPLEHVELLDFDTSEFLDLDRAVYVAAHKVDLQAELPPQDGSGISEPPAFLGKTNLPGDYMTNGRFFPMPTQRWRNDLLALRALAEVKSTSNSTRRTGRRPQTETDGDTMIIGALQVLLRKRGRDDPPTGREIIAKSGIRNVSRFMWKVWDGQKDFEAAWRQGDVSAKLAQLVYKREWHSELQPTDRAYSDAEPDFDEPDD